MFQSGCHVLKVVLINVRFRKGCQDTGVQEIIRVGE